ncbi:aldehyde dehydrogenase family protein [Cupriavidus pinatubonensis]|uniref:3-succinoylsemialdehyde-pyridine dehydrogenase n=1 Tax=Cupriavidus pinatubonensis TaxID=248026 RepID=A0ABN7YT51_9BURK|nr:aldehyde dehydrogenase family protein [Cupriavidus pinatubonensis]CAG9175042.1 3-succinoylsemialdehyde-pyridine dehydrogenase [Cupriavidus pinatubonensis]
MKTLDRFYIQGEWVTPAAGSTLVDVINPATEAPVARLAMGTTSDADRAVAAARDAFVTWSQSTREERIALLERIAEQYRSRVPELAEAVRLEMGAPVTLCNAMQAPIGLVHIQNTLEVLRNFAFETTHGKTWLRREPVGVAALITPWNVPLNQIAAKVAPALAAGCTVVLKPSEIAPLDAVIFAEIMHAAGTPPGVFNMIFGDGPSVGAALSSHPDVDMVSITGSTRAGVEVAKNAAPTVKRVAQELGGKSPLVVLDDADMKTAVSTAVAQCMVNTGQVCVAPTRLLVPRTRYDEALAIAAATAGALQVGDPADPATKIGPLSNRAQFDKVQQMIGIGIEEGARVIAGGLGRPDGLERGFYVRPTVFADVHNSMTVAREEIFGPVLCVIPYDSEEDAIAIANDTVYGLAAYVASGDAERSRRVAARLRAGTVRVNFAPADLTAPFGGVKRSGNGREFGAEGLVEFLEWKAISL